MESSFDLLTKENNVGFKFQVALKAIESSSPGLGSMCGVFGVKRQKKSQQYYLQSDLLLKIHKQDLIVTNDNCAQLFLDLV